MSQLDELKSEYEEWQGNLPDSLSGSPVAEKLENVIAIDLEVEPDIERCESLLDEIENVELPLGFGKD